MTLRKGLLWLMLVSLGLSAVGGALAVLTEGRDIVWRVVGTGLTAAVAAGLLLSLSVLLDKEKSRSAGLLGIGAVVAAFLLTLALIWDISRIFTLGFNRSECLALTLLALLLCAPPAALFLRLVSSELGRLSGIVGASSCAIAFVLMLAGTWWNISSYSEAGRKLWLAATTIGLFGGVGAANVAGWGVDRRYWRWIGILASAAGTAMALIGVWSNSDRGAAALIAVTGLAVIVGHANLAVMCPLRAGQQWVRIVTIVAVVICAVLLDISAWQSHDMDWEIANRGAGAAGIVAACGSLALLILARLNRRMTSPTAPVSVKELSITCPWCQRRQNLALGDSRCANCGLKFRINIEEPRCPNCDYLLYMLQSDRCPECGTPVEARNLAV